MKRRPQPLVLVTGAASGIGKATSERLLHDGARVIALDRSAKALAKLANEKGRNAPLYVREFDLLQIGECSLDSEPSKGVRPDHTASASKFGTVMLSDGKLAVNRPRLRQKGPLIRALIPVMTSVGGGRIVNVASRNALRSTNNVAAYNASKAGLLSLTQTAAGELAKHGIRVNSVCPGVINTPMTRDWVDDRVFYSAYIRQIPMGRFGKPEEIASIISFLLSDDAEFITGQTIIADGGQIACQDNERFMEVLSLRHR